MSSDFSHESFVRGWAGLVKATVQIMKHRKLKEAEIPGLGKLRYNSRKKILTFTLSKEDSNIDQVMNDLEL